MDKNSDHKSKPDHMDEARASQWNREAFETEMRELYSQEDEKEVREYDDPFELD